MSAFICDRRHILFLVTAAETFSEPLRWFHEGQWHELDIELRATVANMLWQENIASVKARYPGEETDTLPGPCNETFVITSKDFPASFNTPRAFAPEKIFKACDCYAYQSCEHDEWPSSEAKAFIEALRHATWHALPGYNDAEWGAPK